MERKRVMIEFLPNRFTLKILHRPCFQKRKKTLVGLWHTRAVQLIVKVIIGTT